MPTRSHVFPQKLSKYEILQKLQIANERRNMNVGFPPFLMRLCVAKGRAGLKPGGHYQREDDEAEFESTWGCMRRSRGAWEHWKHFTSLVEPQWHSTARGVWKHSGHSVGPELGLMIILQKEKNIHRKNQMYKPLTANCEISASTFTDKKWKEVCWPWNETNKHLELELRSLRGRCNM